MRAALREARDKAAEELWKIALMVEEETDGQG